jgi:ubiquinone/menaquinone biosynthesis C-methylase UbiE
MGKYLDQYRHLWKKIQGEESSHAQAVGGDFDTVGLLEFNLLKQAGLQPDHRVVDVGCGSGRLASKLANYLTPQGGYVGTDILPNLLDHARSLCRRPEWEFIQTNGQEIPVGDNWADVICYFSVMTHITHEETWQYILESKRALKPGGVLVCSFLEFRIRSHWWIFKNTFADKSPEKILNQFLSRDAFEAFAFNASLDVVGFQDGDKPSIPIEREIVWENGVRMSEFANLGQSICILRKPIEERPLPT